jgi:hypothetical protein
MARHLLASYKHGTKAFVTQHNPYGYEECDSPPDYGSAVEPENDTCNKGVATFIGGLAIGIAGVVTSEVVVGWAGVIAGGLGMIAGAYDIKNGCFGR